MGKSIHPARTWLTDTPGYSNNRGIGVTDGSHLTILDDQLDALRIELGAIDPVKDGEITPKIVGRGSSKEAQ